MPSTLGIISSHVRYSPPAFSIVPNKTTLNEGENVTYTITTTNYSFPDIYITNSGTTSNVDYNPFPMFSRTIPLVGGTATFTISALNDTAVEGPETIIVQLRTGSTTGPIVATAPTVTINDMSPVYSSTASYDTGVVTQDAFGSTTIPAQPNWDGRWFKIAYTLISNSPLASVAILTGTNVTQTLYSYNTPDRSLDVFGRLNSTNSLRISVGYRQFTSMKSYRVQLYPQTNV